MALTGDPAALDEWLTRARVLLIDDEPANLQFLRHVLELEGYGELIALSDPVAALTRFDELKPDLVMVDLMMPGLDGFEVMARLRALLPAGTYLPILVATADHTLETRRRALSAGARDFLTKPLSPAEVRLRVRNLLETRFLHEQLRQNNAALEDRVAERTHELEEARLEVLHRLARAAEFRDDQTGQHTIRVGRLAARMGQVMGLAQPEYELIGKAAPLHDIGKIGIPDAILLKPDRLEPQELAVMRTHTEIGAEILSGSRYPLLQLAEGIALTHHEWWGGGGYPRGLAGEAIPIAGRIVSVADVFDSLTHERPYKAAWTVRDTLAEIERNAGTQFDPGVVDALLRIVPEVARLEAEVAASSEARESGRGRVAAPPTEVAALTARLRQLERERDELARENLQLRRQQTRRGVDADAVGPAALPS